MSKEASYLCYLRIRPKTGTKRLSHSLRELDEALMHYGVALIPDRDGKYPRQPDGTYLVVVERTYRLELDVGVSRGLIDVLGFEVVSEEPWSPEIDKLLYGDDEDVDEES